jgi:hypothetical protein
VLAAALFAEPRAALALTGVLLIYGATAVAAAVHCLTRTRQWTLLPHLPIVFATIHITWGLGLLTNVFTGGTWPSRVARTETVGRLVRRAKEVPVLNHGT